MLAELAIAEGPANLDSHWSHSTGDRSRSGRILFRADKRSGDSRGKPCCAERLWGGSRIRQDRIDPDVSGDGVLVITTSKFAYSVGEPVVITIKNNGDETLVFPDSALGLEIQNTNTGVEYGAPEAQVITELEP